MVDQEKSKMVVLENNNFLLSDFLEESETAPKDAQATLIHETDKK